MPDAMFALDMIGASSKNALGRALHRALWLIQITAFHSAALLTDRAIA